MFMAEKTAERHFLKIIAENKKWVMARIATLLARKGYNIVSICAGDHIEKGESSVILTVTGNEADLQNAEKLLNRLVNVISVSDVREGDVVEREHCLMKIKNSEGFRKKIEGFGAKILKENGDSVFLELVDYPAKVGEFVSMAKKDLHVIDISRSGTNAI